MTTIHIDTVTINAGTPADSGWRELLKQLLTPQPVSATLSETTPTTPPAIGRFWAEQGGVYAGLMRGHGDVPDYHLIVAAGAEGHHKGLEWGGGGITVEGASSDFDGLANTLALFHAESKHPAAEFAASLLIEGHSDWYLPSRRELRLLWCTVPELFEGGWYWSSTQYSAFDAWDQGFGDGTQSGNVKAYEGRVRAVRRFLSA